MLSAETLRVNKENGPCHHRVYIISYTSTAQSTYIIPFMIMHKNNNLEHHFGEQMPILDLEITKYKSSVDSY